MSFMGKIHCSVLDAFFEDLSKDVIGLEGFKMLRIPVCFFDQLRKKLQVQALRPIQAC